MKTSTQPAAITPVAAAHPVIVRRRRAWKRRLGLALAFCLGLGVFGAGILKMYGNEILPPLVDAARVVLGPEAVAGIEADVYGLAEQWRQVQRDWGLAPPIAAPWAVNTPPPDAAMGLDGGLPAAPPTPASLSGGDGSLPGVVPTDAPAPTVAADLPPLPLLDDTPSATTTATAIVTSTATDTATATVSRTATASRTPRPTRTPRRRPSFTPTLTPQVTAPADTPLPSPTAPAADTPMDTPTLTPTPTARPVALSPTAAPAVTSRPVASPTRPPAPPSSGAPPRIAPIITNGALPGEGVWVSDGLPVSPNGGSPGFWKTFLRPNPARPEAMVYLVRFDPRRLTLHMVAGTQEPVSATPVPRSGMIAPGDVPRLAAAFNGGWKSVHGDYGMQVNGLLIAPAKPNAMTLAQHAGGWLDMGPWSRIGHAADIVSFRQNCPPMIDLGQIRTSGHTTSTWGLSLLNEMYIWRSGLAQMADGSYVYAAGTPLSVDELALALRRAGAVEAMQLDINSAWVRWVSYLPDGHGGARATGLVPAMYVPPAQYLRPGGRDFFYLTWKDP